MTSSFGLISEISSWHFLLATHDRVDKIGNYKFHQNHWWNEWLEKTERHCRIRYFIAILLLIYIQDCFLERDIDLVSPVTNMPQKTKLEIVNSKHRKLYASVWHACEGVVRVRRKQVFREDFMKEICKRKWWVCNFVQCKIVIFWNDPWT